MADLAASDVAYTILNKRKLDDSRKSLRVRLAFGDGVDTVPAGGIPLTKGKLGCPVEVESLKVVDQGTSGYRFQYDQSAEKLVVMHYDYDAVADGAAIQASAVAIAAQTIEVEVLGW